MIGSSDGVLPAWYFDAVETDMAAVCFKVVLEELGVHRCRCDDYLEALFGRLEEGFEDADYDVDVYGSLVGLV